VARVESELEPHIRLGHEVESVERIEGAWTVHTTRGDFRADYKWFLPTRRPRQRAWPNLREPGLGQAVHGTSGATALMRWLLE